MSLSGNSLKCGCNLLFFQRFLDPVKEEIVEETPIQLRWENVDGSTEPSCIDMSGNLEYSVPLKDLTLRQEVCFNPRKLACSCDVPVAGSPCGCGYCANGGSCNRKVDSCQCPIGYAGLFCVSYIEDIPTCGQWNEVKCYNNGICKDESCSCESGWKGIECDIPKDCQPDSCKPWQACRSIISSVDTKHLTQSVYDYVAAQTYCVDKRMIVNQIFHANQKTCDPQDDSDCPEDFQCSAYGAQHYCSCPLDTPYDPASKKCVNTFVKCEEFSDCRSLKQEHMCVIPQLLDDSPDFAQIRAPRDTYMNHIGKLCICVDEIHKDPKTGQCSDEVFLRQAPAEGFRPWSHWQNWHLSLILGSVIVAAGLGVGTVISYQRWGTISQSIRSWERRIKKNLNMETPSAKKKNPKSLKSKLEKSKSRSTIRKRNASTKHPGSKGRLNNKKSGRRKTPSVIMRMADHLPDTDDEDSVSPQVSTLSVMPFIRPNKGSGASIAPSKRPSKTSTSSVSPFIRHRPSKASTTSGAPFIRPPANENPNKAKKKKKKVSISSSKTRKRKSSVAKK